MDIYYILGIIGAVCVLGAFFISNFNHLSDRTRWDEILNLVGSTLLIIYAWNGSVWPFVVLNVIWAAWSLWILLPFSQD